MIARVSTGKAVAAFTQATLATTPLALVLSVSLLFDGPVVSAWLCVLCVLPLLLIASFICCYLLPRHVAIQSKELHVRSRWGTLQSTNLADIEEIEIRLTSMLRSARKGLWRRAGHRGIRLLLRPSEKRDGNEVTRTLGKTSNSGKGRHRLIEDIYYESPEHIAEQIAVAVHQHCGRNPIIRLIAPLLDVAYRAPETTPPELADGSALRVALHSGNLIGIRCVACDYDLRGHRLAERCPECGTPVKRALGGQRLALADARWLRRLRVGCLLLLAAGLASLVPVVFTGIGWASLVLDGATQSAGMATLTTAAVSAACALTLLFAGTYVFTWREPDLRGLAADHWSRRLTRRACLLPVCSWALLAEGSWQCIVALTWQCLAWPLLAALCWYCSTLLRRVPTERWGAVMQELTFCGLLFAGAQLIPLWPAMLSLLTAGITASAPGTALPTSSLMGQSNQVATLVAMSIFGTAPAFVLLFMATLVYVYLGKVQREAQALAAEQKWCDAGCRVCDVRCPDWDG
ncbi:MAG: hypothetical protein PVJ57_20665 [Phycisphaerae bacterium]